MALFVFIVSFKLGPVLQLGSVQSAASGEGTAAGFTLIGVFDVFPTFWRPFEAYPGHDAMAVYSVTSWTRPLEEGLYTP